MTYAIGIDLGTTNSALCYCDLDRIDVPTQLLPISQNATSVSDKVSQQLLPSYIYVLNQAEYAQKFADADDSSSTLKESAFSVGAFARQTALTIPGRVIHSAKSWLTLHHIDHSSGLLPWESQDLSPERLISPTHASALILRHCAEAWNSRFPNSPLHEQAISITVPASFDYAACERTREAARLAGFSENVVLLE